MGYKQRDIRITITAIYVLLMCSVYLLYFQRFYFDITESKYSFFHWTTIAFIVSMLFTTTYKTIYKWIRKQNDKLDFKLIIKNITCVDIAFYSFIGFQIIAGMLSPYHEDAIMGTQGRYLGMVFYILVGFAYYYIKRYFKDHQFIFKVLLITTFFVYLLAVLNFFNVDPLGFSENLTRDQVRFFYSTIGNMNFLSSLICMTTPITIILYLNCNDIKEKVFYHVMLASGFMCLVIANSDSGYLGLGACSLMLLLYISNDTVKLQRLLLVFVNLLLSARFIAILTVCFQDNRGLETISNILANSSISAILLVCIMIFYLIVVKYKIFINLKLSLVLFISVIGIIAFILYYVNVIDRTTPLGFLENYLRYTKSWGTYRGVVWNMSLDIFKEAPLQMRLFGYGPDTLKLIITDTFGSQSLVWDNAHNEYLQYLVTGGLCTLLSYLCILIGSTYRLLKHKVPSVWLKCAMFAVLTYAVQAIVNINQPITTPLFFLIMAMSQSHVVKDSNNK